jgi:hypothetical protein
MLPVGPVVASHTSRFAGNDPRSQQRGDPCGAESPDWIVTSPVERGAKAMDIAEVAERLRIERTLVSHVRAALWVALRAEIQAATGHHWLERFNFLVESFSRHLRRLFAIEEDGGYMNFLIDSQQPGL